MKRLRLFLPVCTLFFLFSCFGTQKTGTTGTDDGIIDITFLQLNDVYEIAPLGDNTGGMARVASIRKELLAENPNTFTVLAGDFISPSVTGTLKYEGQRIRGRQMVDVLNTLGLDWVVFGNHEFDYDLSDLQARLDQSDFVWMAANARLLENDAAVPFYKNRNNVKEPCPDQQIIMVKDKDGTSIKLGLFGVLITSGKKPWVQYSDPVAAAKQQYSVLKNNADVVVGLTHRDIVDDLALAAEIPGVPLWMGGHDHTNMFHKVGTAVVAKADANARTVYIHRLQYNTKTHKTTVKSELRSVNASIADEPATAAVVAKWETIKEDALKSAGFDARKPVKKLDADLDCREATIRNQQAPVGVDINQAMLSVSRRKPVCAVLNSGSIRVDDVLSGTLTELDVIRMLPFGGGFSEVLMTGDYVKRVLDAGVLNRGTGGYLQVLGAEQMTGTDIWKIGGQPLAPKENYWVVLPDFLLTGNEKNLAFLKTSINADGKTTDNIGILQVDKPLVSDKSDLRSDLRLALIDYWKKH